MGFRLLILTVGMARGDEKAHGTGWADLVKERIQGMIVDVCDTVDEAMEVIGEADAAFGYIVPELFVRAKKLRWIASPLIGPRAGYFHKSLVESDVVVTNPRGIYSDHLSAHIMAFLLSFARGFHKLLPQQIEHQYGPSHGTVHLPDSTALIIGVGGTGAETARLCSAFGMTVLGTDARLTGAPPGLDELHKPEALHRLLPRADFVIMTVPHTSETEEMIGVEQFRLMKRSAFLINIGRGATVVLDDLVDALYNGEIAGAGLDVFQVEPLPPDHPLWDAPGALITPHMGGSGPFIEERRMEIFLDNCVRFNEGKPQRNVVDKARWF